MLTGVPVIVTAAGPTAGPRQLAAAYAEAAHCLRALHILGRTGVGGCAVELGVLGVLVGNEHDVSAFVTSSLGPLLEYDARRGTELVRTLGVYFGCGGSLVRAKDELHVHVNTLVQRLDRVAALIGRDWNTSERALELQLALRCTGWPARATERCPTGQATRSVPDPPGGRGPDRRGRQGRAAG